MNGLLMLALWAAVAGGIALIAAWSQVLQWANTNAGISSWVQAVGSILAIAATGWAVQRGHILTSEAAVKRDLADEVRKLSAIASCIFHCRAETESLKRYSAYLPYAESQMEPLKRHVQLLQSIQLLDIPDWVAAVAVGRAISLYSFLEDRLRAVKPIEPLDRQIKDDRVGHCKDVIAKFEECELMLRGTLQDRGADVPRQQMAFADTVIRSLSAR